MLPGPALQALPGGGGRVLRPCRAKRAQLRARRAQVGGFLQRIDYVRKYAFGVMCILKDDKGQFPIRCAPGRPLMSHE